MLKSMSWLDKKLGRLTPPGGASNKSTRICNVNNGGICFKAGQLLGKPLFESGVDVACQVCGAEFEIWQSSKTHQYRVGCPRIREVYLFHQLSVARPSSIFPTYNSGSHRRGSQPAATFGQTA